MKRKANKEKMKICLVGSSGGHLTHLYMLKPFWKDKDRFWVTFDKEDARSILEGEKMYPCYYPTNRSLKALIKNTKIAWKVLRKSQLFISGFIIQIAGFAVILIMAFAKLYTPQSWYILCLPGILIYLGYGMLNVIMTIFLSDSVDYGEVMNGTREESVIFSMQTFTVKLASGVAVFLAGLVVDWIHLDTAAAVQTQDTLDALRMWMTIPSVILLIVGIFVFKRFYKLDDTRMEEIKSKLN